MNPALRVVGFDTSLANFGMVAGEIKLVDGRPRLRFVDGLVIKTEKNPHEPGMNKDHLVRFGLISRRALSFTKKHDPHVLCVEQVAIVVNKPNPFQRGGAAQSTFTTLSVLGRARGLVDMLSAAVDPAFLLERSAVALKKAATGNHRATKEEMIDAMVARHPELEDFFTRGVSGKVLKGEREHVADAAAAILACRMDPVMLERLETVLAIDRALAVLDGGSNFDDEGNE